MYYIIGNPARVRVLLYPWDALGKNTKVGHHALLQRIFPTWGLNLHLLSFLYPQTGPLSLARTTWEILNKLQ